MFEHKELVGLLESIHLLRKLFLMRVSETSPLHFGQIAIMKTIEKNENCTQSVIAEQLGVTPASVATSTKRLQKAGLITKTVDEDNMRCKRLALTEKGRLAIKEHLSVFEEYDRQVFSDFSEEDEEKLFELLSRVADKMRNLEGIKKDIGSSFELTAYLHKKVCNISESDKENKN